MREAKGFHTATLNDSLFLVREIQQIRVPNRERNHELMR